MQFSDEITFGLPSLLNIRRFLVLITLNLFKVPVNLHCFYFVVD